MNARKPEAKEFMIQLNLLNRIPVDLAPVVYCSVVSEGTDKEWNFLWNKFRAENVAAVQETILKSLGCTKQAKLIEVFQNRIESHKPSFLFSFFYHFFF